MKKLLLVFIALFSCSPAGKTAPKPFIHYYDYGKGTETLLFVHGWCIDASYWDAQVAHYKDRYRVVTVDLRGSGKSTTDEKNLSIEQDANDVADVIRYLALDSVILVGHSMAGDINLRVLQQVPDRIIGFVGVDNLQEVAKTPSAEEQKETEAFMKNFASQYKQLARQYSTILFSKDTDPKIRDRVLNDILNADPDQSVSTIASLAQEYKTEQTVLPTMKIPLLLIVTEGSITNDSSLRATCGAGYHAWEIAHTGHYPMIERPAAFDSLLDEAIAFTRR